MDAMNSVANLAKHSVSMPAVTSREVQDRVGPRGFSSYVTAAVSRQLERDALDDILERMEQEHGSVDQAEVDAAMARLA
jgi:hypothetical protein